ncbi:MAG: Sec-independent protein translocase protein TatB [Rhizobiaceae bacterium]
MFDVGWTELVVIACVAVLVVGPKDLPRMLRAFGKTIGQVKRMAGDFQKQFDDALKEADLDEVRKVASSKTFAPLEDARKSMQAFQKDVNDSVAELEKEPAVESKATSSDNSIKSASEAEPSAELSKADAKSAESKA